MTIKKAIPKMIKGASKFSEGLYGVKFDVDKVKYNKPKRGLKLVY